MALAPYFDRAALAAAQVLSGFNPDDFASIVSSRTIAVEIGPRAAESAEGRAIGDLTVRLLARLYPRLQIDGPSEVRNGLESLALTINPRIEIRDDATVGVRIGDGKADYPDTTFTGSNGWIGRVSSRRPLTVGTSDNPFGPGVAACLAAANVFRRFFPATGPPDRQASLSAFGGDRAKTARAPALTATTLSTGTALVGLGAVGNAAAWALGRAPVSGAVEIVDDQVVELSNLQRYVLCTLDDVGREKTSVVRDHLGAGFTTTAHTCTWASFVEQSGMRCTNAVVALDSAGDRRAVQTALPRRVFNAWTQPGDLGVSSHGPFGQQGACLYCLYLPVGVDQNEDAIIASALGVSDKLMEVRQLLHSGAGVSLELINEVATRLDVSSELAAAFAGRPLRALYVEGLCGGALLPLSRVGSPRAEVHVPLAHQSALAGILLAAALVRAAATPDMDETVITRVDVLRPLGSILLQKRMASAGCICRDADWVSAFRSKWSLA